VAFIILIILNEMVIGGSGKGKFASCAHALNWRNILNCVALFSLVSSAQVSSSNGFTQAQRHLYHKAFSSPKGYPSIKVGVVGRSGSG